MFNYNALQLTNKVISVNIVCSIIFQYISFKIVFCWFHKKIPFSAANKRDWHRCVSLFRLNDVSVCFTVCAEIYKRRKGGREIKIEFQNVFND